MTETRTKNVLLVEDHAWFRQAIARFFDKQEDLAVVGEAGTLAECRDRRIEEADVALVDLGLPDGEGTDLIRWLRKRDPTLKVLALTVSIEDRVHERALEAGAEKVLSKSATLPEILDAIREATGADRDTPVRWRRLA